MRAHVEVGVGILINWPVRPSNANENCRSSEFFFTLKPSMKSVQRFWSFMPTDGQTDNMILIGDLRGC
jgi:hypothetical protein